MQFIGSFTTFNPISGNFNVDNSQLLQLTKHFHVNSESFPLILDSMADRARNIISGRQIEEINAAIDTINYIFHLSVAQPVVAERESDAIKTIAARRAAETAIEQSLTPAQLLRANIPHFDINKINEFPNAKWQEYFAILTLAALGNIHRFHHLDGEFSGASVGLAAECMEALVIAENPSLFQPELNRPIQEQICIRNQQNAIKGHAVLNEWKQRFADWVDKVLLPTLQGKRLNKREAARQFKSDVIDPILKVRRIAELERRDLIRILADSLPEDRRLPET